MKKCPGENLFKHIMFEIGRARGDEDQSRVLMQSETMMTRMYYAVAEHCGCSICTNTLKSWPMKWFDRIANYKEE